MLFRETSYWWGLHRTVPNTDSGKCCVISLWK